jgi:hypothetical protein
MKDKSADYKMKNSIIHNNKIKRTEYKNNNVTINYKINLKIDHNQIE